MKNVWKKKKRREAIRNKLREKSEYKMKSVKCCNTRDPLQKI